MMDVILAGFTLAALYVLLCLASPVRKCPDCRGTKTVDGRIGRQPCGKCRARGRVHRLGARTIHRLAWEHAAPWIRQKFRDNAERLRDGTR